MKRRSTSVSQKAVCHLHTRRRENLKCHKSCVLYAVRRCTQPVCLQPSEAVWDRQTDRQTGMQSRGTSTRFCSGGSVGTTTSLKPTVLVRSARVTGHLVSFCDRSSDWWFVQWSQSCENAAAIRCFGDCFCRYQDWCVLMMEAQSVSETLDCNCIDVARSHSVPSSSQPGLPAYLRPPGWVLQNFSSFMYPKANTFKLWLLRFNGKRQCSSYEIFVALD
jgi:hypothetical protein